MPILVRQNLTKCFIRGALSVPSPAGHMHMKMESCGKIHMPPSPRVARPFVSTSSRASCADRPACSKPEITNAWAEFISAGEEVLDIGAVSASFRCSIGRHLGIKRGDKDRALLVLYILLPFFTLLLGGGVGAPLCVVWKRAFRAVDRSTSPLNLVF